MTTTVENISKKIFNSYTDSLHKSETKEEKINKFLDMINDQKKIMSNHTNGIKELNELVSSITWLDNINIIDEIFIKAIIGIGKDADKIFKKNYAILRRVFAPKGLLKEDLKELKEAIDIHIETIKDLDHIIFYLRKDKDFKALDELINEI